MNMNKKSFYFCLSAILLTAFPAQAQEIEYLPLQQPFSAKLDQDLEKIESTDIVPIQVLEEYPPLSNSAELLQWDVTLEETQTSQLQSQETETEETPQEEEQPQIPPEGMNIRDPKFKLGIIQPIPDLQLQLRSFTLTNPPLSSVTLTENTMYVNAAILQASPKLGANTRLSANVASSLVRFSNSNGYNLLNTNLGVLQKLNKNMSGELTWKYRSVFGIGSSNNLFENSAKLALRRVDQLSSRVFFKSGYEFEANFTDPTSSSRISNIAGLGLGYNFSPKLQGIVNYRLFYDDFTRQNRNDLRHEIGTQLIYQIQPDVFIGGSFSYVVGDGTNLLDNDPRDLDNISIGLYLGVNVTLLE